MCWEADACKDCDEQDEQSLSALSFSFIETNWRIIPDSVICLFTPTNPLSPKYYQGIANAVILDDTNKVKYK